MSEPNLNSELRQALDASHGCLQGEGYILMSTEVFRNTMGVGSDEELADSLQTIEEAMADLNAGRTISLDEAKKQLAEKYDVSG